MKFSKVALAVSTLLISGSALAHGFIENPPSRDRMCQMGKNTDCGGAQYEPQSVAESQKGFPAANTSPDGQIPSGGKSLGAQLNAQTSDRWAKNKMHAGENKFTWHFTARHATTHFQYFITKQGWDQNKPLTRESFELTPFCVIQGHGQLPAAADVTHTCQVPERTGYQVIYAAWEIDNTSNSFYKTIDAQFESSVPTEWTTTIGSINPYMDLVAGDNVKARFFDAQGERDDMAITLEIKTDAEGKKERWSKMLADQINRTHKDVRAGVMDNKGQVNSINGLNTIYVKAGSQLNNVEVTPDTKQVAPATLELSNVADSYMIENGKARVTFDVATNGKLAVNAKVFNSDNAMIGWEPAVIDNSSKTLTVKVNASKAGKYKLVVTGSEDNDKPEMQKTVDITLKAPVSGDVDFVFPEGQAKYKAGTRVLQPKNNTVYECKNGPEAGWCKIYTRSANHYEPGVGGYWQEAWNEVGQAKK